MAVRSVRAGGGTGEHIPAEPADEVDGGRGDGELHVRRADAGVGKEGGRAEDDVRLPAGDDELDQPDDDIPESHERVWGEQGHRLRVHPGPVREHRAVSGFRESEGDVHVRRAEPAGP